MSRNRIRNRDHMNTDKKPKRLKRIVQLAIFAAVAVTAVLLLRINALAVFNEDKAMRFSEYSASHTIDNSVLFVGTYLININAMSDEIYQKAQESQSESNQLEIYYKSELADGSWFDETESRAIRKAFPDIPQQHPKELFGETLGCGYMMNVLLAAASIRIGIYSRLLVSGIDMAGNYTCVMLEKQ